MRPKSALESL